MSRSATGRAAWGGRLSCLLAACVFVVATPRVTAAQTEDEITTTDLWVPLVDEFARLDRDEFEVVFSEVLGGPSGPHHVVGLTGLTEAISRTGFDLPPCFEGRDVCSNNVEAIARGLRADRVIYVNARERGEILHLTLVDIELGERVELEVRGENVRESVFSAVSAVTDASGVLSITSEPSGASVFLDGVRVGTTPYESTLGIGAYDLRLELEGYYDHGAPIELRANDRRAESVTMQRRYARVLIETEAPGAEIVVNGRDVYPAGEPFDMEPGSNRVEIRAPGYDSASRDIDVSPGEERSYRVTLVESAETIARRKFETIRQRPLAFQLGFVGSGFRTTWSDARVRLDGTRRRIGCAVDPTVVGGCLDQTPVGQLGADLDVIYDLGWFELELFGFGVRRLNLRTGRTTYSVDGQTDLIDARAGRELFFQLPEPGIRYQIDQDWSVAARTGPAVTFQRIEASRSPGGQDVRMRRTDWLWQIDLAGRYHVSAGFYAFTELGLGLSLDAADTRARLGATLGIGFNLADPLGVQERLQQRRDARNAPATDAPEDL